MSACGSITCPTRAADLHAAPARRQRWRLEDRLAQALRELAALAHEAEERRLAREREEQERHRLWEQAMTSAKAMALEAHRLEILRKRMAAWEEADRIHAYCAAVEAR